MLKITIGDMDVSEVILDLTVNERLGRSTAVTATLAMDGLGKIKLGSPVTVSKDGAPLFKGFAFTKQLKSNNSISVTAYDAAFYLRNSDRYSFMGKSASDILSAICKDHSLPFVQSGQPSERLSNVLSDYKTLMSYLEDALNETELISGKRYYVSCGADGKIALKLPAFKGLSLSESDLISFNVSISIAQDTFNSVALFSDTIKNGQHEYTARNVAKEQEWGTLKYAKRVPGDVTSSQIKAQAEGLLAAACKPSLSVSLVMLGRTDLHAGEVITVTMPEVKDKLLLTAVTHRFDQGGYTCECELSNS